MKLTKKKRSTRVADKSITCDASNNPPTTFERTLNVRIQIRFDDQHGDTYSFTLPIDLNRLRTGKLKSVKVIDNAF